MLTVNKSKSVDGAKIYFREALQRSDYYSEGDKTIGSWHGRGAKRLGLSDAVQQSHFYRLLENRTPLGDRQLTLRNRAGRVPMIDFTFSAPKDLSLLWALADSDSMRQDIQSIHQNAVHEAMIEVERNMEVRVRKGDKAGTQETRKTGNAIWAEFLHDTSRPVDGIPDPQLHTHAVVINASHDPVEHCFKAAEIGNIKGEAGYYEAIYHSEVAKSLIERGFDIVSDETKKGRFWTINGLSREFIAHYSRRTQDIEQTAKDLGITKEDTKADLGRRTRERKDTELESNHRFELWRTRLWPKYERELNAVLAQSRQAQTPDPKPNLRTVVRSELGKALQSASVTSEKNLLARILQRTYGHFTIESIKAALDDEDIIRGSVEGRSWITSAEAHRQEQSIIGFARKGLNSRAPLGHGEYTIHFDQMNDQQRAAVHHIWQSTDRVMILRGGAGVGKTRGVMVDAVQGLEHAGHKVFLFATSLPTTRDLIHEGYKGAVTIQKLLANKEAQENLGENVIIWVEEAGLMDVAAMEQLFDLANKYNWRIILSGDEKQHKPSKRGDAMRILRDEARLPVAEVTEIQRQNGIYKQAVETIERGKLDQGWAILEDMGSIIQAEGEERLEKLAADYLGVMERGSSVLVVAPTNQERTQVTDHIRKALRLEKKIGRQEITLPFLRNLHFAPDSKQDIQHYRPQMVIRYRYSAKGGIRGGSRFVVEGISDTGELMGSHSNGEIRPLPLGNPDGFDVYTQETRRFSTGDRVRATEAGLTKDKRKLEKGEFYTIEGFTDKQEIILTNGMVVPSDYVFLDHGYSSTSVSAQGLTVDTVLLAMGKQSLPAMSKEQFYVSTSRGKRNVRIYVDDVLQVREAIKISGERPSATQLLKGDVRLNMTRDGQLKAHRRRVERHLKRLAHGIEAYDASLTGEAGRLAIAEHMGRVREHGAEIRQ